MGPAILIDKSTLQSLSEKEAFYLRQYYHVIYCPTLFYEILGDLTKHKNLEASKKEVLKVSCKMWGDSCFTTHYRTLLMAELMGYEIFMDGRPVLSGGEELIDGEGRRIMFFDDSPEQKALRKWTQGEYSEAEKQHSKNYRNLIKLIDLDTAKIHSKYVKDIKNLNELKEYTSDVLGDPEHHLMFLQFILTQTRANSEIRNTVCNRWLDKGMPNIKGYAPYSYYYLSVSIAFYFGIANNLLSNKKTNLIDLEYIFYMPFCKVFTSTDKFLRNFSQKFLTEGQEFIWGNDLKVDLKSFCDYWESKGEEARFSYQKQYGNYPPDIPNSLTCKIWKRWAGEKREMTPEREQEILQKITPILRLERE